jgi:hypothetical protein
VEQEEEEEEEDDNIYGKFVCITRFVSKWIVEGRGSANCDWIFIGFLSILRLALLTRCGYLLACERKCESSSGPFVA